MAKGFFFELKKQKVGNKFWVTFNLLEVDGLEKRVRALDEGNGAVWIAVVRLSIVPKARQVCMWFDLIVEL